EGMIVVGNPKEIDAEFWDALRATLEAYIDVEDQITLPSSVPALPWNMPPRRVARRLIVRPGGATIDAAITAPATAFAF
ncbi:MAG: hypothetical protein ACREPM_19200, partial [Gemmatimonadaceae bacterium]